MIKQDLDTPCVLIDLDKLEINIAEMQSIADKNGVALRPHAKTHKLPVLSQKQVAAGAIGITVAKLSEAEVMAASGIMDIMIAYPIVGAQKVERVIKLAQHTRVTVAIDSFEVAKPISEAAASAGVSIGVVIEIDCGFSRVGVQPGPAAVELAQRINQLPGLSVRGILAFAGHAYLAKSKEELEQISYEEGQLAVETAQKMRDRGILVDILSVGSTPSSRYVAKVDGVTEIRPGTYVFGDLMQVSMGAHRLENCALTIKVTIVSRPATDRAVIDAGTKVFTMDGPDSPIGTGRGYVIGKPGIQVEWLTEEHGMLRLPPEEQGLAIGDSLEIIPVHCCGAINMFDEVAAVRGEQVETIWPVLGRGKVT